MRRRTPRPLATALARFTAELTPASALARVQASWDTVVGPAIASHCTPVGERAGVLSVSCDEAVWAAELELMAPEILARLAREPGIGALSSMRCRADRAGGP